MSDLSNCKICGGKVDWCTACDGCHLIVCSNCKASFDLSESVPNDADTLEELRQQIAGFWNTRAPAIPADLRSMVLELCETIIDAEDCGALVDDVMDFNLPRQIREIMGEA